MPKNIILSENQFHRLLCEYAGVTDYLYPLAQYMTELIMDKFYGNKWDVSGRIFDFLNQSEKRTIDNIRIAEIDKNLIDLFPVFDDKTIVFSIKKTKRFKGEFEIKNFDGTNIPITLSAYFIIYAIEHMENEKIFLTILHELVHMVNIVSSEGAEANEWMTRGYQNKKTDQTYIIQYLFSRTEMNARLNSFISFFINYLEKTKDISDFKKIYDIVWEEMANITGVDIMLDSGDSLENYEINELIKIVPEYFGIKNNFGKYDSFELKKEKVLAKLKSVATSYKHKIDKAMYLTWKQFTQEHMKL